MGPEILSETAAWVPGPPLGSGKFWKMRCGRQGRDTPVNPDAQLTLDSEVGRSW